MQPVASPAMLACIVRRVFAIAFDGAAMPGFESALCCSAISSVTGMSIH